MPRNYRVITLCGQNKCIIFLHRAFKITTCQCFPLNCHKCDIAEVLEVPKCKEVGEAGWWCYTMACYTTKSSHIQRVSTFLSVISRVKNKKRNKRLC